MPEGRWLPAGDGDRDWSSSAGGGGSGRSGQVGSAGVAGAVGGDGEEAGAAVVCGHSGVRANMSRDWNIPPWATAGLSKSDIVIFGLSGLRGRWRSGLASSEEMLDTETEPTPSFSGVRGICLP